MPRTRYSPSSMLFLALTSACCAFLPPAPSRHHSRISRTTAATAATATTLVFATVKHNNNAVEDEMEQLMSSCQAGRNVVGISNQVEQLYLSQPIKSTNSLNTLLRVWQKATAVLADGKQEEIDMTESTAGLSTIITARDAAEHATRLLMEAEAGLTETESYNVVIEAWAQSNYKEAPQTAERILKKLLDHDTLKPDAHSYNGILYAWSNSQDPDSMKRLQQIYKHMLDHKMIVSVETLNDVLSAYANQASTMKEKNAMLAIAADAYELLQAEKKRFQETKDPEQQPDERTYTILIDILGKCGVVKSTLQAESLLTELKELHAQQQLETLRPTVRTYTTLISAWSKTKSDKSAIRGEELLEEMYLNADTKPNYHAYAAVCTCWGKSNDPNKATQVLNLVRKMKQLYEGGDQGCKPHIMVYNAAIDACSRCGGDAKQQTVALKIAFAMNKALLVDGLAPDAMTFDRLMQATAFLMPPGEERNGLACALLEKAKAAGCVSFDVVRNFRKGVDNNVVHAQLKEMEDKFGSVDYHNIPNSWAKHCK